MTPVVLATLILTLCIVFYFLPSIAALSRQHNNFIPIFITNLFFGFSGIGWIICVIWAFTNNVKQQ